jgi:uncharacterized protein YqgQ
MTLLLALGFLNILQFGFIVYLQFRQEEILELQTEERKELLDRFMARNLSEYKSMTGELQVNRSKNGNTLRDQIERAYKPHIEEFEE